MIRPTGIEYVVWFAYLRGGGRIRDIDTRFSTLQAAHHVVSYFFFATYPPHHADRSADMTPRLSSIQTAILPPLHSYAFGTLPLIRNQTTSPSSPFQPSLINLISRWQNTFKPGHRSMIRSQIKPVVLTDLNASSYRVLHLGPSGVGSL